MTNNKLQYVVVSIWLKKYVPFLIGKETFKLQPYYKLENWNENLYNVTRRLFNSITPKTFKMPKTLYADNHNDIIDDDNRSLRWF